MKPMTTVILAIIRLARERGKMTMAMKGLTLKENPVVFLALTLGMT
jgi:hypothetical protein